ncbi:MAG: hypothetical protein JXR91_13580 [Deltaproteobacteria bacterium]|nr:hypothetical protein [Deltaproteobacteria bacterium]
MLKHSRFFSIFTACLFMITTIGCSTCPYTMKIPDAFKRFDSKKEFKFITADGVKLKARESDNYPKASLNFWKDATREHLVQTGYTITGTNCFKTTDGLDACTLKFALPQGAEDWTFWETIFVVDEKLVLIEAAGEYTRFTKIEKELETSLASFNPNI